MGCKRGEATSHGKAAFKVENAMKNITKEFERNDNDFVAGGMV